MKTALLFTGSGPIVIGTSYDSLKEPALLERLHNKGISKFLAYEIPSEIAEARYGGHYHKVMHALDESDDLRILDYNGQRAFKLFNFDELGSAITHEVETALLDPVAP
jgi:hypothetical protein